MIIGLRGPTFGLFGAVINIALLAVDPFTQNIVTSYSCQTASTEPGQNPIMPTADGYLLDIDNWQRRNQSDDFTLWGTSHYTLDTASKAAVYSGLYGSASSVINGSKIQLGCPGVNCTFPRYSSLSICHRYADISSHIKRTCYSSRLDNPDNIFIPAYNWSLPTGQSLSTVALGMDYFYKNNSIRDIDNTFAVTNSTLSALTLGNTPGTFTNLTILANSSMNSNCTIGKSNGMCADWMGGPIFNFSTFAAECALFPCVRTYTATTINGTVTETETGRSTGNSSKWLEPWWDAPNGTPTTLTMIPDNKHCTQAVTGDPCTYAIAGGWLVAAGDFFWRFWDATVTGYSWSQASSTNNGFDILYSGGVTNFTYIDRIVAAVSDSMTAAIRLKGQTKDWGSGLGGGQGVVNGTVYMANTCIGIRWGWIALPAATGGLSIALFMVVVFCGVAGRRNPAWKYSALPTLFYGVRPNNAGPERDYLSIDDMEKKAKTLRVRIDRDKKGYVHLIPDF